jgi:glucose/arabinose dehydrogenase
MGIATRPTAGKPGSYDLVFNVGSEYDHQLSTDPVALSGLIDGTLQGDSLYVVTIDLSGPQPVASNLRQLATGIRNVIGMGFQSGTGDFYFADNAIDGPNPDGDEPPQAEEINRIPANVFGVGDPINFGYPTCYIQYRTGLQIGSDCAPPFFAIQPLDNGTPLGSESEGVSQLAFAPADFPAGFNNGIFLGFSGKGSVTGPANEENAVGYYDFTTGDYIHFSENSQDGVYQPIGIMSTDDALFITDFGAGITYEVTPAVPEPGTCLLTGLALAALGSRHRHRVRHIAGRLGATSLRLT